MAGLYVETRWRGCIASLFTRDGRDGRVDVVTDVWTCGWEVGGVGMEGGEGWCGCVFCGDVRLFCHCLCSWLCVAVVGVCVCGWRVILTPPCVCVKRGLFWWYTYWWCDFRVVDLKHVVSAGRWESTCGWAASSSGRG